MALLYVLNNPVLSLQQAILWILLELLGGIAKDCAREVSLEQVNYIMCHTSGCMVDGLRAKAV